MECDERSVTQLILINNHILNLKLRMACDKILEVSLMNNLPAALLRQVHGLVLQDHRLFPLRSGIVLDRVVHPRHPGDAAAAPFAERLAAARDADDLSRPRATLDREHPVPRPGGVRFHGSGGGDHGGGAGGP